MKPSAFSATVVRNEYIAKETRETTFLVDQDNQELTFQAGQFFNIVLNTPENPEKKVMRAYSVASSPKILPQFKLCVKVIENGKGLGSGFVDRLKKDESVKFSGPFGHFGKKFPQKKTIMVATGTGIAPMKAIIDELQESNFPTHTTLVFGVREEEHAFYREYFEVLQKEHTRFSFVLFISRPEKNTQFSHTTYKGRVTEFFTDKTPENLSNTEFLICGNPAMVKEVRKILHNEKSVDKKNICVEAY